MNHELITACVPVIWIKKTSSLEHALDIIESSDKPVSVGLLVNAAQVYPEIISKNIIPDVVTDQTSSA